MGLEDIKLSLRADDVVGGEVVKVCGEIKSKTMTSRSGGQYEKYMIPVEKQDGSAWLLWVMENDAAIIVRRRGRRLKEYLGAELTLDVLDITDDDGKNITTKDGKTLRAIVITEVK